MNEIIATIKNNKLRTFLTAFGVFWGIFMIVLMLGIGNGLRDGVLNQFGGTASNSFYVWSAKTSMPYMGMKPGRYVQMRYSDIKYLQANMNELEYVVPMSQLGGYRGQNEVVYKNNTANFNVVGATPEIQNIQLVNTISGRFLKKSDLDEKRKVAVCGASVERILFNGESAVGKAVKINGVYFQIVGVFKSTKSDDRAVEDDNKLYIPFDTYLHAFNFGESVGWIAATVRDGFNADDAMNKVKTTLASRLKYHPDDKQALGGWNGAEELAKMNGLFDGIKVFNWIVGLLTLVAGIVGISNIMLIVVKERTQELGVRKALGATPGTILSMIMFETVLLTVVSGYFGIVLGVFVVENFEGTLTFISQALNLNFGIDMFQQTGIELKTALSALTILIIFGGLAGLIPARQAVKINPIEALRDE
ncbi:MAG: ABC transporter permease [Bacteroidia bacterium]